MCLVVVVGICGHMCLRRPTGILAPAQHQLGMCGDILFSQIIARRIYKWGMWGHAYNKIIDIGKFVKIDNSMIIVD